MPNSDGTGPRGQGPMGGRRSGRCGVSNHLQGQDQGQGRGRGRGQGGWQKQGNQGQGNFAGFGLSGSNQDRGFVESWIDRLLSELQAVQTRLANLKAKDRD